MADEDFKNACYTGNLELAKEIYEKYKIDIHKKNDLIFRWTCRYGHLEILKWLHSLGVDVRVNNDQSFVLACSGGNLDVAKWLYEMDSNIDINVNDSEPLIMACTSGNLDLVKWLTGLNKKQNYEQAFIQCCYFKHKECAKWILKVGKIILNKYYLVYEDNKINRYKNCDIIKWLKT
ncbi:MAG: ankyrin repeat domain-containing protein [Candidatus Micrarchaeaceae archaeon]